ncbi:MAG: hypothetical protein KF795_31320 [Labilithrix sp.]|nr:hypothetical protein [Labilithrix sp.]
MASIERRCRRSRAECRAIPHELAFERVSAQYWGAMTMQYDLLKAELLRREAAGEVDRRLSPAERADWAYGNAVIENAEVTREMANEAVRARLKP